MSSHLRKISQFWLDGGHLTNPDEPRPRIAYVYGLDTATQTVRRFASITGLVEWMSEADGRERVASNHAMVKKYRNADLWDDEAAPSDEDETRASIHDLNETVLDRWRKERP